MRASLFTRLLGALDEWLSQRSAKPSTAVRIRQAPPESKEPPPIGEGFLFLRLLHQAIPQNQRDAGFR